MIVLAIVFALLVLIILSLPYLLDLNRYRDQYLPVLEKALNRNIEVEDVRLTLFPTLGVQLHNVVIADDPVFSSKPFLTVPSVQVAVQWRPLLQWRIEVERVLVESPIVQVIRSKNGILNTSTIGNVSTSGQVSSEIVGLKDSVSPLLGVLAVKQFSLKDGTLRYEDHMHQPPRIHQIEQLVLNTISVAIGETAGVDVHGILMPYQMLVDAKGRLGPLQANFDIPKLDIVGHVGNVEVTVHGTVLHGQLIVDVQIPKASTDDIPIESGLTKPVGLSQLQVHLVASLFPKEGEPHSDDLTIDSLRANIHFGKSSLHVSGNGTPSRFFLVGDSPALSSQDFPVSLPLQQHFSLDQLEFTAEIQGETVNIQSFKAKVFDGTLNAQGVLDSLRSPLRFSTQGTFTDFSVEPLLKVIRPSSRSMTGAGELNWKMNVVVSTSNIPTFDGRAHLIIRHGEVIGFDLVKTVEDALKMSGVLGQSTGATQFSVIDAQTKIEKDGLTIQELRVKAPNFSLRSVGKLSWDQSVTLQGTLGVLPSMAEKIIQRYPLAKVVRQEGQLVLPFVVQGTVQDPKFRLDAKFLGNQISKTIEKRLEKVLQGDNQELQKLLDEGKDLLKHFFRK